MIHGLEKFKHLKKKQNRVRKITTSIITSIKLLLEKEPFITIKDIIHKLGLNISISAISKTLKKMKITIKNAISRLEYKGKDLSKDRIEFKKKVRKIEELICLDETGLQYEMRNIRGRSVRGKKIYIKRSSVYYRKQYSCLMVISKTGEIKYELYKDAVNSKKLIQFISDNEEYFKNKFLLLDNVAFHKSKEVINTLSKLNCEVIYTPPYSPYLNPIEEVFSQIKRNIRKSYINETNIIIRVQKSISEVTPSQLKNYYNHAFY